MSFERITTDRALDEMKAGHEVYRLFPADLSISLAEWLTECFVIEEDPPAPVIGDCPPPQGLKKQNRRKQPGQRERHWTGEKSRRCTMRAGHMQRLRMRWAQPRGRSHPDC